MKEKNKNLTAEQKLVLFEEGTEPPGSSELNNEKREGSYHCVNCDAKLFESTSKYDILEPIPGSLPLVDSALIATL